jgi:translation initiation factor IF-1
MPTDFSKFNIYAARGTFMWYGDLGSDFTPYIWINTGDLTNGVPPGITSTNGIASGVPTGWLSLHPGPGSEASVLRWTAPVMGDVHVTGQFLSGDRGTMTVAVRHNNQQIWSTKDAGKFDLNIKIAAGDTIDFAVYGGYGYGNTPVSANISY